MPGYCDAGSVNLSALAGLAAALDWLDEPTQEARLARARAGIEVVVQRLEHLPRVRLVGPRDPDLRLPTAAFCVRGRESAEVASALRAEGVVVGSGLQCAPLAHETLGTAPNGVVRLSAGPAFREEDVARAIAALEQTLSA
jgi:selenocysteine lyase/cysteine desulfurase